VSTLLVTGGAGFIGVNTALHFARQGWKVVVADNLSRRGTDDNLAWLKSQASVEFERCDIRDAASIADVIARHQPELLIHLAAQVAVTTSVTHPREDFEINALGTFNVLEGVRLHAPGAFVINASTNKVYGKLAHLGVVERNGRYEFADQPNGVAETEQLDFYSPYGCSKGVADQYTIDYARIYGLKTVTFRQSCIYGTRQLGIEDQGWVAWFAIAATLGKALTIYGDGKQIRDVLDVRDLVRAYEMAYAARDRISGRAYNVGGGPTNTMSLLELLAHLERVTGQPIPRRHADPRPGDQPVFVCDVRAAEADFGWKPTISVEAGVGHLIEWVRSNPQLFDWMR
jgi:CDP-paratose 2-epimerase